LEVTGKTAETESGSGDGRSRFSLRRHTVDNAAALFSSPLGSPGGHLLAGYYESQIVEPFPVGRIRVARRHRTGARTGGQLSGAVFFDPAESGRQLGFQLEQRDRLWRAGSSSALRTGGDDLQ
jgi:hypothetical protein